jgi:hypothetical protein
MKRSGPIARKRGLRPGPGPRRRTKLAPINPKRARAKYLRNFGPKADWIRSLPCLVPACWRETVAAHARARQMGGCGGDASVQVPLCDPHHREAGEYRTSARAAFEARYGLDLIAEAARLEAEWQGREAA